MTKSYEKTRDAFLSLFWHGSGDAADWLFWNFNQPQLLNRAKKGLKMRCASSRNFWSRSIFVLTVFDFGWKIFRNQLLRRRFQQIPVFPKTKKMALKKLNKQMCAQKWRRLDAAPAKCRISEIPSCYPLLYVQSSGRAQTIGSIRGSTEGFPGSGILPGLRPTDVISEHTFAKSTFWGPSF